jgi:uncharacterized protein (DUF58 family)
MLVSGIFGRKNIYGIEIALEFPAEAFAKTDIPVGVKVVNKRKLIPAFLIKVIIEGREVFIPFVKAGGEEVALLNMRFEQRGSHEVGGIYVSSVFPFNFFTRFRRIRKKFDLIVFPKPQKSPMGVEQNRQTRSKGDVSCNALGHDSDVMSIRDYVTGDPLKYISWKSTAKTGHLKTKELSSIELRNAMIDFDAMDKRNLEDAVSCATYMVLRLMKLNIPVGLVIGGETLKPSASAAHRLKMLTKLASYGQTT